MADSYDKIKLFLMAVMIIFTYKFVFSGFDDLRYDRENALIISANNVINGTDIQYTEIGFLITTGISKYIAIPFVYATGNVQLLSFLFWLIIIIKSYYSNYYFYFALFFVCSWFIYYTMKLRLEEWYYPLGVLYLTKNNYLLVLYFLLNRDWSVFENPDFKPSAFKYFSWWYSYWLYIPLLINYFLIQKTDYET